MATALQLVNRVRRKYRFHDVASFAAQDRLTQTVLDTLNESVREILETRNWPFDERYDGVLTVKPKISYTTITVTNGTAAFGITGADATTFASATNPCVARLVVTSDASYGNTAFRISNMLTAVGNTLGVLEVTWPGSSYVANASGYIIAYEYGIPATVKSVFAAKHEETPLYLEQVATGDEFARQLPRAHETEDSKPELLRLGGTINATYETLAGSAAQFQRVAIYPVPDTAYQIDYAWTVRRSDLSATTDTLEGVLPAVEDFIVELTYARLMFTVGNDPQLGASLERKVMQSVDSSLEAHEPARSERRTIKPIDAIAPTRKSWGWGRLPRTFGSL